MGIIELIQVLSILMVAGYIVIVFQVYQLYATLRSKAWLLLATAWMIAAVIRFWNYIRLPHQIQEAQARGIDLSVVLTPEVWAQIAMGYAVIVCTIIGLHILNKNLKVRLRT